jgi:hypothetical protein
MTAELCDHLSFERELWQRGLTLVAGVDEAGRGPLAGPVVAAAVILPQVWQDGGFDERRRRASMRECGRLPVFEVNITVPP